MPSCYLETQCCSLIGVAMRSSFPHLNPSSLRLGPDRYCHCAVSRLIAYCSAVEHDASLPIGCRFVSCAGLCLILPTPLGVLGLACWKFRQPCTRAPVAGLETPLGVLDFATSFGELRGPTYIITIATSAHLPSAII